MKKYVYMALLLLAIGFKLAAFGKNAEITKVIPPGETICLTGRIYEKEEKTKEKTFLGNLSKILNVSQHCSKSHYATFEAMNGTIFTIRLANHNTKVSNFDNLEESEGFVVTHNEHNKIKDKNK